MKKIKVIEEEKLRIDIFLAKELDKTRSQIKRLTSESKILLNGKVAKPNNFIINGDIIEIEDTRDESVITKDNIALDIIYEDEYLLVINKQSGLVVHPAPGNKSKTLVNALMYHYDKLSSNNGMERPGIVHRIDKDTTGLLIVAKDDKTHQLLAEQLKKHEIQRIYDALVEGLIMNNTGTIDAPIGRDERNRKRMTVTNKNSKSAITHFKVLERYADSTLIECNLETGRTHQIRVHLAYINHPIVGDSLYGATKMNNKFGQYLHAKKIVFTHPITGDLITLEAPMPKEFADLCIEKKNA